MNTSLFHPPRGVERSEAERSTNVLFYINSHVLLTRQKPDKTKLYFSVNAMFYDDCEEETKGILVLI